MKKIKIGINGFGRIGRLTARIIIEKYPNIEIVSVNDLTSAENLAYLFKHDSTYKESKFKVFFTLDTITINNTTIKVYANKEPIADQWKDIDVVLECTGKFLTSELANLHLKAGSKKVVLSAPAKDDIIKTFVMGCNENELKDETIISNASCTTNCLSPILKILDLNLSIQSIMGVTVHAMTATQVVQDGPSQKDFRDGRASSMNLIPSKTGASKAVELVVPSIKGKLNLSSLRAPIISGSCIYLFLNTTNTYNSTEINNIIKHNEIPNLIEYSTQELVSTDVIGNPHSVIFDSLLTETIGTQVKVVLWYDNEWGYSNRLADIVNLIGSKS